METLTASQIEVHGIHKSGLRAPLRFVWQAQHLEHLRFVLRSRRSTWGTLIKVRGSHKSGLWAPPCFASQAQHLGSTTFSQGRMTSFGAWHRSCTWTCWRWRLGLRHEWRILILKLFLCCYTCFQNRIPSIRSVLLHMKLVSSSAWFSPTAFSRGFQDYTCTIWFFTYEPCCQVSKPWHPSSRSGTMGDALDCLLRGVFKMWSRSCPHVLSTLLHSRIAHSNLSSLWQPMFERKVRSRDSDTFQFYSLWHRSAGRGQTRQMPRRHINGMTLYLSSEPLNAGSGWWERLRKWSFFGQAGADFGLDFAASSVLSFCPRIASLFEMFTCAVAQYFSQNAVGNRSRNPEGAPMQWMVAPIVQFISEPCDAGGSDCSRACSAFGQRHATGADLKVDLALSRVPSFSVTFHLLLWVGKQFFFNRQHDIQCSLILYGSWGRRIPSCLDLNLPHGRGGSDRSRASSFFGQRRRTGADLKPVTEPATLFWETYPYSIAQQVQQRDWEQEGYASSNVSRSGTWTFEIQKKKCTFVVLALSSCVCGRYRNDRVEVNYVQRPMRYQRWAQHISCMLGAVSWFSAGTSRSCGK